MGADIRRMWINQPSTLQAGHKLHGTCVLADFTFPEETTVYFLSGDIVSQQIDPQALSQDWPEHLQEPEEDCEAGGYVPPEMLDTAVRAVATKIDADLVSEYHKHFSEERES